VLNYAGLKDGRTSTDLRLRAKAGYAIEKFEARFAAIVKQEGEEAARA
jgi:hypothetical protein